MRNMLGVIWEKAKQGDNSAWAELVESYSRLVYTVARRVGLTAYDAEDCAQHTWLALYRNRRVIRDPERLPSWLILTTRRQAIRMLRRRKRANSYLRKSSISEKIIPPDEELLRLEQLDGLEKGIAKMGPRCRKLLEALFLAENPVSYQDLAKSLNISLNSLGPIRSRCLKRLKKIMEEMGY